jgi:hypothetical protein
MADAPIYFSMSIKSLTPVGGYKKTALDLCSDFFGAIAALLDIRIRYLQKGKANEA